MLSHKLDFISLPLGMVFANPVTNYIIVGDKLCMFRSCRRPKSVREDYTCIKLQKDTHRLWAERKIALQLKSDMFLLSLSQVPVLRGALCQSMIWWNSDENLKDRDL